MSKSLLFLFDCSSTLNISQRKEAYFLLSIFLTFVQLPLEYFIPSIYYTIYLSPSIFLPLLNNLKGILPVRVIDSRFRFSSV